MAGIVNTKTCACCKRELPLDLLVKDDELEHYGTTNAWLCIVSTSCMAVVQNRSDAHNCIVILDGLLDRIDNWLFATDGMPYPAWDNTLSDLVMYKPYADPKELAALIAKLEAKGMKLSAAMLKEPNETYR